MLREVCSFRSYFFDKAEMRLSFVILLLVLRILYVSNYPLNYVLLLMLKFTAAVETAAG